MLQLLQERLSLQEKQLLGQARQLVLSEDEKYPPAQPVHTPFVHEKQFAITLPQG